MKNTIVLLAILLTISCTNQPQEFRGIANLKIGTEFSAIPNAEKFTKVMPNEYNMKTYNLSHNIGSVSDLNITTENGIISEVKFASNEITNIAALEKITENMVAINFADNSVAKAKIQREKMNFYTIADSTIFYAVIYKDDNFKNGNKKIEYRYSSKEVQLRKMAQTLTQFKSKQ